MRQGSPPRKFDPADLWSAVKVGRLVGAGVLLTYLESYVSETDFGVWTGLVGAAGDIQGET